MRFLHRLVLEVKNRRRRQVWQERMLLRLAVCVGLASAGLPPASRRRASPRGVGRAGAAAASPSMSNLTPLMSFGRRSMEAAEVEREARRLAATRSAKAAEDRDDHLAPSAWSLALRACYLSLVFAPVGWTALVAACWPWFRRRAWYGLLTRCLGLSGACFVKWAQWSATRSDLFPDALCARLASLGAGKG